MYKAEAMLPYLSLLTNYGARAACDYPADDRVEGWFEIAVRKGNPAFGDP
jgi:hypothetical protein